MKTGKAPDHWPYVSSEQQFEGFKAAVQNMDPKAFKWSMFTLVLYKYMSKSHSRKLTKWYREIHRMSYDQWLEETK